jgi:hypothetical protein
MNPDTLPKVMPEIAPKVIESHTKKSSLQTKVLPDSGNAEEAAWDTRLKEIQKLFNKHPTQSFKAEKKEKELLER